MDARALLELQIAWGAGAAMSPTPLDRFSPQRPQDMAPEAVPKAAGPPTLDALRAAILALDCPLRATVTNVVLPQGSPGAGIVIVGEVPDGDADTSGFPYAGQAGATLDAWLASAGMSRDDVLLIPALPWRPPGARPPTAPEEALARPFVQQLLALGTAAHVLALGSVAARMTLETAARPGAKPGAIVRRDGRMIVVLPGIADCARRPAQKRVVWAGLRALRRSLDEISA